MIEPFSLKIYYYGESPWRFIILKMGERNRLTLFIFRRDLRIDDNTALIHALETSAAVIPAFIFTPQQIEHNPFRSDHCLQFMIESLEDLEKQLHKKKGELSLFYGEPHEIVEECIDKLDIDAVMVNRDYTPYSQARDKKLATLCKKRTIDFLIFDDALLHPPEKTVKADGKPYTIFTPFFRNASKMEISAPQSNRYANYYHHKIPFAKENIKAKILPKRKRDPFCRGGREEGLNILSHLKTHKKYEAERDFPALTGTTHLSPHLKFTTCSPREIYYAIKKRLGEHHPLLRQLYWRDFFTSIGFYFPHVFTGAFHKKYDDLPWSTDKKTFRLWCEGKTGFPIVDAGMRELNETGWMHNRVRMIVSSFLVKDLHLSWQWGEKYFAQTLVDYDPCVNNGNWQWAASTGCDAQPYFRIFNPWNQQEKFDPECHYIKKWIPELSSVPIPIIHDWNNPKHHDVATSYLKPIIDHAKEVPLALKTYKNCSTLS